MANDAGSIVGRNFNRGARVGLRDPRKEHNMANDIGEIKSIGGTSMNLNTQKGSGGQKPEPKAGSADPGGTKPPHDHGGKVPMPK
jgi:hypothetical protein